MVGHGHLSSGPFQKDPIGARIIVIGNDAFWIDADGDPLKARCKKVVRGLL